MTVSSITAKIAAGIRLTDVEIPMMSSTKQSMRFESGGDSQVRTGLIFPLEPRIESGPHSEVRTALNFPSSVNTVLPRL